MNAKTHSLPLFYQRPEVLQFDAHAESAITTAEDYGFAAHSPALPLCAGEFLAAGRHYPIVFSLSGGHMPMAVTGLGDNRNLFIEGKAWRAHSYVPAYVRRYPFILTRSLDGQDTLLSVDTASPRFAIKAPRTDGYLHVFDADGQPMAYANTAMDLCMSFNQDYQRTESFAALLLKHALLRSFQADVRVAGGRSLRLEGFCVVDEARFRALPADVVAEWHGMGWLDLIILHLASQHNWSELIRIYDGPGLPKAVRTAPRPAAAAKSNSGPASRKTRTEAAPAKSGAAKSGQPKTAAPAKRSLKSSAATKSAHSEPKMAGSAS